MHPALLILVVSFLAQAVAWIGHDVLLEACHLVYVHVVQHSTIRERTRLRKDVLATKKQLAQTSSKDQFAKWARLKRHSDKSLSQLEAVNNRLATSRTGFSLVFRALMFLLTTIFPMLVTAWHRKVPIFYLPPDSGRGEWFGPLGKYLSLPSAPAGAVSATIWYVITRLSMALAYLGI